MSTAQRQHELPLIRRLLDEPHAFDFTQCVRIIEFWLSKEGALYHGSPLGLLRFENTTSLSFPASQLESIRTDGCVHELLEKGVHGRELLEKIGKVRITPAFIGMLGVCGALPTFYTEVIEAHLLEQRDDGPKAFLDTFSSRAVSLFYESTVKYKPHLKQGKAGSRQFLSMLLALGGAGSIEERDSASAGTRMPGDLWGFLSAPIRQRPTSTVYIEQVLREYFSFEIKIEPFVGDWYVVPDNQRTALGFSSSHLGSSAMVGGRTWQRDLRQRITIGPLDGETLRSFLPGNQMCSVLKSLLSGFSGPLIEYEVALVLRAEDVASVTLGNRFPESRLGENAFLCVPETSIDRKDIRYLMSMV